ncbi:MAG: relaxase domain-containing protein [Acidimicrobiia bacterium]|nr:relaxase domain-containing protein [Acidimicrobiia bacterium]
MSARTVVVVMRVTTLKASAGRLEGLLAYYAGLAEDRGQEGPGRGPVDYYLDPDEPPGRWWGHGRAALGLEGTIAGDELRAVLDAHHPTTGARLGRRFGDASARGFDATFSPPKLVSVLWALSPDPCVRAEVLAAHDTAVETALGWFEQHGAVTRRGRDGVHQVDAAGITVAVFRQHTSRAMDPQLHTHAVIVAKVQDETGRWLALDARFLKYQQRTIGTVYDAALRTELTGRLGVVWTERDPGVFDLACVPDRVRDGFSKRCGQVDAKLAELVRRWSDEHDGATPDARTIAGLERAAAVASRPGKTHTTDAETLRAAWVTEARDLGFDPDGLVAERITEHRPAVAAVPDEDLIEEALFHASTDTSAWLRADLARHLATILDAHTTPTADALVVEIDRLAALAEASCIALGPEHHDTSRHRRDGRPVTEHLTDRHFTTPGVLAQEHHLQHWAARNARRVEPVDDPQTAAAQAIAGHDRLVLVVGPAGTGKTHTTARAVTALDRAARPVIGLAPSGKAADVLAREAGCATDTVAGFLTRHRGRPSPWPAGTTVILDEAGMTATDDLARLVALAERQGWRLAAVGDPYQLPAVGRGGVFAHWCDTLSHHALEEPRRFGQPWEAAASLALRRTARGRRRLRGTRPAHQHPPTPRRQSGRASPRASRSGRSFGRDHRDDRGDGPGDQHGDPIRQRKARPRGRVA